MSETTFNFLVSGIGAGFTIFLCWFVALDHRRRERARVREDMLVPSSTFEWLDIAEETGMDIESRARLMREEHEQRKERGPCGEQITKHSVRGHHPYTEYCQRPKDHEGSHLYGYIPGVDFDPYWNDDSMMPPPPARCPIHTTQKTEGGAYVGVQCVKDEGHEDDHYFARDLVHEDWTHGR